MATVILTAGKTRGQYTDLQTAWAAIPNDVVGSGNSYVIEHYNDGEVLFNSSIVLTGKTTDAVHNITIRPVAGEGYYDNPNVLTNKLRYNPSNGVAFQSTWSGAGIQVNNNYVTVTGFQGFQNQPPYENRSGSCFSTPWGSSVVGVMFDRCLAEVTDATSAGGSGFFVVNDTIVRNCVTVSYGGQARLFASNSSSATFENCTGIRLNNSSLGYGFDTTNGTTIRNSVIVGADFLLGGTPVGSNNAWTGVISFGTNNKNNIVPADCFVDVGTVASCDPRLKAGSVLVDAGTTPQASNVRAINGNRQQGTAADIGAWEFPQAVQAPTATIQTATVNANKVTLNGVYTGIVDRGLASISTAVTPYNSAVSQGPIDLTFSNGTFSAVFSNVKVGQYLPTVTVGNADYPSVSAVSEAGNINVIGATATSVIQDPIAGQVLTVHGSVTGAPISGTLLMVPAAVNPNGAIQQEVAFTPSMTSFTVSVTLPPGNYEPGILRLTNVNGTSLPQPGTQAVSIIGFSGSPEAQPIPVPTVTSVAVTLVSSSGTDTVTKQFSATVTGTNDPSQEVTWSTDAGNITAAGLLTIAKTNTSQTVTVTATSKIDATKSASMSFTVGALVIITPPPPPPSTVTGVTVSLVSATDGDTVTKQFSAVVAGTGNPSQAVLWGTDHGSISDTGLLSVIKDTVPTTVTVTATSVADPSKGGVMTLTVPAKIVVTPDPVPDPLPGTVTEGTLVAMQFLTPDDEPLANSQVEIQLKSSSFHDLITGILMPRPLYLETDDQGQLTVELMPCDELYYVTVYDKASDAALFYKFYVPLTTVPGTVLRLQDIVVDGSLGSPTLEEATLLTLAEAKASMAAGLAEMRALLASAGTGGGTGGDTGGGTTGPGAAGGAEVIITSILDPVQVAKLDGALGNMFVITVDADFKIPKLKNPQPGVYYTFFINQDKMGGHAVTFDKSYRFSNNSIPVPAKSSYSISELEAKYSSSGFFFSRVYDGYSTIGLIRIGNARYETMGAGINAAVSGDTIYIVRSGHLGETTATLDKPGVYTFAGAPELPTIPTLYVDETIRPAYGKGIINIEVADLITVRDLAFDGAQVYPDNNASAVRFNPDTKKMLIHRTVMTNGQNGMLTGMPRVENRLTAGQFHLEIMDAVFDRNGITDAYCHNIYLGHFMRVKALRSQFTNAVLGHDFKTRADYVLLDRCELKGGKSGRELDVPDAGMVHAVNTVFWKLDDAGMNNLIGIGHESVDTSRPREYILRNCQLQNDRTTTFALTWIENKDTVPVKLVDCVFIGACYIIGPFELIYTGGPIGPEGWDQTKKGVLPRAGFIGSGGEGFSYPDAQQPYPVATTQIGVKNVDVDPTLVAFPPTGSTSVRSVRPDLADAI